MGTVSEESPSAKLKRFTMDSPLKPALVTKDEHDEEKCHACVASPVKVVADECLCSSDDSDVIDLRNQSETPKPDVDVNLKQSETSSSCNENDVTPVKRKLDLNGDLPPSEESFSANEMKTPPKRRLRMFSRPQGYFKLTKIYERFFGSEPPIAHTALEDCKTLLKILSFDHKNFTHRVSSEFNLIVDSGFPSRTIRKFSDIDFYTR